MELEFQKTITQHYDFDIKKIAEYILSQYDKDTVETWQIYDDIECNIVEYLKVFGLSNEDAYVLYNMLEEDCDCDIVSPLIYAIEDYLSDTYNI